MLEYTLPKVCRVAKWGGTPVTPALKEGHEIEGSLGYKVRPCPNYIRKHTTTSPDGHIRHGPQQGPAAGGSCILWWILSICMLPEAVHSL